MNKHYKIEWKFLEGDIGVYRSTETIIRSEAEKDEFLANLVNNPRVYLIHLTTYECIIHREPQRREVTNNVVV